MAKKTVKKAVKQTKKEQRVDKEVELKNQLARALADYDNLRKRIEKEQSEIVKLASSNLIVRLLPIVDMLNQAQANLKDTGLAIAINEIRDLLKEEGVVGIDIEKGDDFNEDLCEAVESVVDSKSKSGTIAEVLLPGWKYEEGPVLRHAKVKVYKNN